MGKRLDIDNPFYDSNASPSAFGWEFQVDAAIFLFVKYIDQIEKIIVEGKYQDIELICKGNKRIYAQAKSVSNGSNDNRKKKLEDAIISLAKCPTDKDLDDNLLYISNYSAPIKEAGIFNNAIIRLEKQKGEKAEFEKQIQSIVIKLDKEIKNCRQNNKKNKLKELKNRIKNIDSASFLVSTIFPYNDTEQQEDKYRAIFNEIDVLLSDKFNIKSQYLRKLIRQVLSEWQLTMWRDATQSPNKITKELSKDTLLWQIVVILSDISETDMDSLFDEEIEDDLIDEFEGYYDKSRSILHNRFEFFNKLVSDYKEFAKQYNNKKQLFFVKTNWSNYIKEFYEFQEYSALAKEYLIKKSLMNLLNSKNNISKIIEGRYNDY